MSVVGWKMTVGKCRWFWLVNGKKQTASPGQLQRTLHPTRTRKCYIVWFGFRWGKKSERLQFESWPHMYCCLVNIMHPEDLRGLLNRNHPQSLEGGWNSKILTECFALKCSEPRWEKEKIQNQIQFHTNTTAMFSKLDLRSRLNNLHVRCSPSWIGFQIQI